MFSELLIKKSENEIDEVQWTFVNWQIFNKFLFTIDVAKAQ